MADINLKITPRVGPGGHPLIYNEDGLTRVPVKITIPASSTYSTTDRCRFAHSGEGSINAVLGINRLKQVILSGGFSTSGVNRGELQGEFIESTQRFFLTTVGNSGAAPLNVAEVTNGTALGAVLITAEASLFF